MSGKESEITCAVALRGLALRGSYGRGIKLADDIFLSNDSSNIKDFVNKHISWIGVADAQVFLNPESVFVYSHYKKSLDSIDGDVAQRELDNFLMIVQSFLAFTWLIKDNCIFQDCGFSELKSHGNHIKSKNYMGDHFYLSTGSKHITDEFTAEEIKNARELFHMFQGKPVTTDLKLISLEPQIKAGTSSNRISRCLIAVFRARQTLSVEEKIAQYISGLEGLFSTSSSELNYRLSERIAFFLGEHSAERKSIFNLIKNAYQVRSTVVHGATMPKNFDNHEQLTQLSVSCDDLVRKSLEKCLSSKELIVLFVNKDKNSNAQIDEYFSGLVFGSA